MHTGCPHRPTTGTTGRPPRFSAFDDIVSSNCGAGGRLVVINYDDWRRWLAGMAGGRTVVIVTIGR